MENIKSETTGQKRIDTIATDIKKLVAGISNGKPANVTEENMDKFLSNIKEAFNSWNNPIREKDGKLRMSVLGKPPRQLWYDRFSPKKTKSYDASLNIKFLYGHILEHLLLYLAELTGHKVADQQKKVEIDNIKGHIDATVDGEVCDVKSASSFSFKKFKTGELVGDDPFGYHAQLSGYETGMGTNKGGFLVMDKSTGDVCFYKPDELAKPNVPNLIKTLQDTLKRNSPPDRCYQLSETKGGNKSLPIGCQFCAHKWECYQDANDGKGLRVFKYSNRYVYLAQVNRQPNVEEITKNFSEELKTYGKRKVV